MSLEELWHRYYDGGYAVVRNTNASGPEAFFYLALLAFGHDDILSAARFARSAAGMAPDHPVYRQGVTYLDRVLAQGKSSVYVDGDAFAAFVRGGGNVGLYAAVSNALRTIYQEYETLSLLDIGVGDGLALLPALTSNTTRLDLIEPSEAMLAQTTNHLNDWNVTYHAHPETIQSFMKMNGGESWDLIEATWSLQSVPPWERPAVFEWMRQHGARVAIAEFDVPDFTDLYAPERVRYIVEHYVSGLGEYEGDLVAQGFLMPVMFGYFDRTAARTNYEEPIQAWIDGLRAAGFEAVEARLLYRYWWAESYLIDAR